MSLEREVQMLLITEMTKALEKLVRYIKDELKKAFSWTPEEYVRTGNMQNSVYISKYPKITNNIITGEISFLESLAWHNSVMGEGQPKGYVPFLLEVGWSLNSNVQPRRENFTDHIGYHYIEKAVARFNSEHKSNNIQAHVYVGGSKYI